MTGIAAKPYAGSGAQALSRAPCSARDSEYVDRAIVLRSALWRSNRLQWRLISTSCDPGRRSWTCRRWCGSTSQTTDPKWSVMGMARTAATPQVARGSAGTVAVAWVALGSAAADCARSRRRRDPVRHHVCCSGWRSASCAEPSTSGHLRSREDVQRCRRRYRSGGGQLASAVVRRTFT